ncbi:MAG: helix-turn-helix domain-containing protein [Actinomycetota bacterium]
MLLRSPVQRAVGPRISLTISHSRDILRETYAARAQSRKGSMARGSDLLDEVVAERRTKDPALQAMVDAALDRRRMLRRLTEDRIGLGLSQTAVAAKMGTSQSAIARIESGKTDVKLSTLDRYAATLGRKVEWRLAPAATSAKSSVRERSGAAPASAATAAARKASLH